MSIRFEGLLHPNPDATMNTMRKKLIYLGLTLVTLPAVLVVAQGVQQLLSRAAAKPANIIVDVSQDLGPVNPVWAAFSQGGEEPPPMLGVTVDKMRSISPRFIRLDHIYDSYSVVSRTDSGFTYDFSRLDQSVDHIIAMGALPFFSLTYMPAAFSSSGSLIDTPTDWQNWKDLVRETIEHYSGKNEKNLTGVYYEVWNEPELPQFGSWKMGGDKDYRLLYFHSSSGAKEASNVNEFKFGGPAVGSFYGNWVSDFVSYAASNQLRLDFYSWHRYHKRPQQFASDAQDIRRLLASFPTYAAIPLILTEWGIESDNTPINNSSVATAFTVATVAGFVDQIQYAFTFEVKDGPPPNGGKWGLLTHEKSGQQLSIKPRFKAFESLNHLKGKSVKVTGLGTFVGALAAKEENETKVLVYNYDLEGGNSENVPITFTGLDPSSYKLTYTYVADGSSGTYEMISTDGSLSKSFPLTANTLLELSLQPEGELANFMQGTTDESNDQALILLTMKEPLVLNAPSYPLGNNGKIIFDIKPFWDKTDTKTFIIFDLPYQNTQGSLEKLYLSKRYVTNVGNQLMFGISARQPPVQLLYPIDSWYKDSWHKLEMGWQPNVLTLSVDSNPPVKSILSSSMNGAKIFSFYPIPAAVDNFRIISVDDIIVGRLFNNRVDR